MLITFPHVNSKLKENCWPPNFGGWVQRIFADFISAAPFIPSTLNFNDCQSNLLPTLLQTKGLFLVPDIAPALVHFDPALVANTGAVEIDEVINNTHTTTNQVLTRTVSNHKAGDRWNSPYANSPVNARI